MKSTWNDNVLVTEHSDIVPLTSSEIVGTHKLSSYGKKMGIDYSWFESHGNIVKCSFTDKVGPLSVTMNFEKYIENYCHITFIHFRTVKSIANIEGRWIIIPTIPGFSKLHVQHEIRVPKFLKWLPIKKTIESKIQKIYDTMKIISQPQ